MKQRLLFRELKAVKNVGISKAWSYSLSHDKIQKYGTSIDILSFIYLMNKKARLIVKTPVGDTDPILLTNLDKQGTVLVTAHLTKCQRTVMVIILTVFR